MRTHRGLCREKRQPWRFKWHASRLKRQATPAKRQLCPQKGHVMRFARQWTRFLRHGTRFSRQGWPAATQDFCQLARTSALFATALSLWVAASSLFATRSALFATSRASRWGVSGTWRANAAAWDLTAARAPDGGWAKRRRSVTKLATRDVGGDTCGTRKNKSGPQRAMSDTNRERRDVRQALAGWVSGRGWACGASRTAAFKPLRKTHAHCFDVMASNRYWRELLDVTRIDQLVAKSHVHISTAQPKQLAIHL